MNIKKLNCDHNWQHETTIWLGEKDGDGNGRHKEHEICYDCSAERSRITFERGEPTEWRMT